MSLKVQLRDEERNAEYEIKVDDQQYEEIVVNGNLALATQLLNRQLEKENFKAAFNMLRADCDSPKQQPSQPAVTYEPALPFHDDNRELDASLMRNDAPSMRDSSVVSKLWTDDTIIELINLCKKYEKDFEAGIKRYIWAKIAQELTSKFSQEFTIQQCDTKWKGLKNMYKIIKKHNDQSGNNRKYWKFFDYMNDVLFARPEIQAPATCSSLSGLVLRNLDEVVVENNIEMPTERINEETNVPTLAPTNSTPSSSQFQSSFMRKRKAAENAVERRHREKLARQDRYLDLLERLTTAVERSSTSAANSDEAS